MKIGDKAIYRISKGDARDRGRMIKFIDTPIVITGIPNEKHSWYRGRFPNGVIRVINPANLVMEEKNENK